MQPSSETPGETDDKSGTTSGTGNIDIVAQRNVDEHWWWLRWMLNMTTHEVCGGCQVWGTSLPPH